MELNDADYIAAIELSAEDEGWEPGDCAEMARTLLDLAATWPVGTVVERRLDELRVRWFPAATE